MSTNNINSSLQIFPSTIPTATPASTESRLSQIGNIPFLDVIRINALVCPISKKFSQILSNSHAPAT